MAFTKNTYYQEKFRKMIASEERVAGVEFEACEFSDCSFMDCTFTACRFINCTFERCAVSAMIPTGSHFVDVRFISSKVIGVDWTKAQRLQDVHFTGCQINYSNFRMMKLPRIRIIGCEAKETDFTGTDLREGIFTDTDFERCVFTHTILTKADFRRARNYFIDLRVNTVKHARFSLPEALSLIDSFEIIVE